MYSEEVVAGIQYDVGYDLVLGASYIHRDLGRIIEDMSPNAGSDFLIANPGETPDPGAIKDLQSQIAATTDPMKKAALTKDARPLSAAQRRLPQAEAQLRRPRADGDQAPLAQLPHPGVVHLLAHAR